MAFAFSPEQRERLFDALGRSDSGAWHLTEDVEQALEAYGSGERSRQDDAVGIVQVTEFEQTLAHVASMCAELYRLPERARQLSAIGTIQSDVAAELARLAQFSGDALERLGTRLAAIGAPMATPIHGTHAMAERFVHAVGQAFRNRLNIKPSGDAHGLFRRFLDALVDLVRRRHADLDELAQVLSEQRLASIIGGD